LLDRSAVIVDADVRDAPLTHGYSWTLAISVFIIARLVAIVTRSALDLIQERGSHATAKKRFF
jgi:hypothetical protein